MQETVLLGRGVVKLDSCGAESRQRCWVELVGEAGQGAGPGNSAPPSLLAGLPVGPGSSAQPGFFYRGVFQPVVGGGWVGGAGAPVLPPLHPPRQPAQPVRLPAGEGERGEGGRRPGQGHTGGHQPGQPEHH